MYWARLGKKVVYPLNCHGSKFLAQKKEGSDTQPNTNGGDFGKHLHIKTTIIEIRYDETA